MTKNIQTPNTYLPYGAHQIDDDDIAAVSDVLRSNFLTTGPYIERFESALAEKLGAKFAVVCSSGTAALHLAAVAIGIQPGEKVIVPSITFLATANAVRYAGGEVVFADVNPDSGIIDKTHFAQALENNPDAVAIFPVHLRGQRADMDGIQQLARKKNIKIVEDACHAIGTTYNHDASQVGDCAQGDATVFSFHPVKTIAMGEGGAITTNDQDIANRMRRLRSHAMHAAPDRDEPWFYEVHEMGFNYRASDLHCALGLSQLKKLDLFVERRRQLVGRYDSAFAGLAPLLRTVPKVAGENPGWHLYGVLIDFEAAGISRADLMRSLKDQGIGTQVHYIPVHMQPYYTQRYGIQPLLGAEQYYHRCLSLPLFQGMQNADVDRVVQALKKDLNI